jgi:hypothetical protein
MSAAQSCVGFGLFSLVFDYLGGGAAQALSISRSQVRWQQHSAFASSLESN